MAGRYLMWTLTTFVAALFLFTFLSFRWIILLAAIAFLAMIPAAILKYPVKKLITPCLAAFLAAALFFSYSENRMLKLQSGLIDREIKVSGEVTDLGTNAAGDLIRYKVRLTAIGDEKVSALDRVYFNLYCRDDESYLPGSAVHGTVKFFESAVDYGLGREDRILLSGIQKTEPLQFSKSARTTLSALLYRFRIAMNEHLSFGKEETRGLLRSVCLGDTDTLDPALSVSLRRIGLTHVTAVSGLHLSFTVLLFNFLLISLGLHYRVRYLIDIFIAIVFTALVGFPFSCVRACIMVVLMCLAMALDLFEDSLTSLAVAAFLITIINPFAVRDVGFLLSISATAGIIVLRLPIENFLFPKKLGANPHVNWVYRKLTGPFACSIAATITTLPIVALVFGSVSLIGPFANVLLIYPLEWVFMMGILMVLLGWIPGVGIFLGWLCDLLYELIHFVSGLLGRIPFASVSGFSLPGIVALVLLLCILGVGIYDFLKKKRRTVVLLFFLLLSFLGTFGLIYEMSHPDSALEIAFIDVGQGDCTVISRDHTAVIVDYGGTSGKRYNLINYLKKKNIYTVELLAFTHLHSDHANGLSTLLKNVYVEEIIYPDLEFNSYGQMELLYTQNGTSFDENMQLTVLGDVTLRAIADAVRDQNKTTGNEQCVCYQISFGDTDVLVTGDLTGESELLLKDQMEDVTILKVAHHGSTTSSIYPFIKAISPEIAVISVGENVYGLPKDEVIERLKTVSNEIYQTIKDGTLVFRTDGTKMERIHA